METVDVSDPLDAMRSLEYGAPMLRFLWNYKVSFIAEEGVDIVAGDSLLAFDLKSGERPRRILPLPGRPKFQDPNPKIQFGGVVSRKTLVAPLVEEVLRDQSYRGIPIKVKIPIRKLAGFDLATLQSMAVEQ